jgi:hypothetical protein
MNHPAADLDSVLRWLREVVTNSLEGQPRRSEDLEHLPIELSDKGSVLANFIDTYQPSFGEFVVLALAMTPHVEPMFLNDMAAQHRPEGGDWPAFGGVRGVNHRGILPTGETAQFILAGNDLERRLCVQQLFSSDHWFARSRVVSLESVPLGEPVMSGRLVLDPDVVELLTSGSVGRPRFSIEFPAEYISTDMEWSDLVLNPATMRQVKDIQNWITHNETLLNAWGMKKKIKPGYRALFYGPPGAGKTLTAMLLGKHTGRDVFRIDLSRVVSKYIGETEKNLSRLFDKAEHKDWILFFDEADALFGKRTDIRDAHDKYANQEVSYLLQRIEGYNGIAILATNQRTHIDDAFTRRLQTVIHFPMPSPEERCDLWRKTIPTRLRIADDIDWRHVAARYELTSIEALANDSRRLDLRGLEAGITRELVKEGKVV